MKNCRRSKNFQRVRQVRAQSDEWIKVHRQPQDIGGLDLESLLIKSLQYLALACILLWILNSILPWLILAGVGAAFMRSFSRPN